MKGDVVAAFCLGFLFGVAVYLVLLTVGAVL